MISGGSFDPDKLSKDLLAIENKLQDPEVWKDHKKLNEFNKQKTVLETKVNEFSDIEIKIADIDDLVSISIELNDSEELKCNNPVSDHFRKGSLLGITGTPTIILEDGRKFSGYIPANELIKIIENG